MEGGAEEVIEGEGWDADLRGLEGCDVAHLLRSLPVCITRGAVT